MTVSPERIEEAREKLRRAVEDGERLYRKGMHDPDGLTATDEFRISGILSLDLPAALGAYDRLAAALREAREQLGRYGTAEHQTLAEAEAAYRERIVAFEEAAYEDGRRWDADRAALREAQAENERLQRKIDAEIPWTKDGAYEALQAENERLREALDESDRIIGAMCRDGSFFATLTSDALRERLLNAHAANRGALAPADEAKP